MDRSLILLYIVTLFFLPIENSKEDISIDLNFSLHKLFDDKDNSFQLIENKKKEYKLILVVDGDCSICVSNLSKFEKRITTYGVTTDKCISFAIVQTSFLVRFEYIVENNKINCSFPIYIDTDGLFFNLNSSLLNQKFECLLLDPSNKVVFMGSPTKNKEDDKILSNLMSSIF